MQILISIITLLMFAISFLYFIDVFKGSKKENLEKKDFGPLGKGIIIISHDLIKELVRYETEQGFALPNDFKTDPAAWLEVLRSIEYAFDELYKEYSGEPLKETSQEKMAEREVKIQKGLELFGKYLRDLN